MSKPATPDTADSAPGRQLRRSDIALLLFVLAVAAAGYLLARQQQAAAPRTLPVSNCDINQGPCQVELPGGGHLQLEISPRPAPTLRPFTITLRLDGPAPETLWIELNGASMDMGMQRIALAVVPDTPGPGRLYQATATLPVCTTGPMIWRATVRSTGRAPLLVPFDFLVGGRP